MSARSPILAFAALVYAGLFPTIMRAAEHTYSWFRFTPLELRDELNANSVQLSEFELWSAGQAIDLSAATITNPGGDNPTGEEVENIADQSTGSKWLDFNKGPLVFEFPEDVTIDAYRFATAYDEPERDPVKWTLEGSDDGMVWTLLDQRNTYPTPTDRETFTDEISIPSTTNLTIQTFRSGLTVLLNGNSTNLDWEVYSADAVAIHPAPGLVADTGVASVTPPSEADTPYVLTATRDGNDETATLILRTVQGGDTTWRHVRFTPDKLRENATASSIQLAEFAFFHDASPVPVAAVSNPGGNNPQFETPALVIDGNTSTKWLDFNKGGLVFDFGTPVTIDAYQLTTANDNPERDPVRWTLEGSNDGATWTLIENLTAFDFPVSLGRGQPTQVIPLPGASLKPLAPFAITSSSFNFTTSQMTLTFRSREDLTYRITSSPDLGDWPEVVASGIPGAAGQGHTTVEVPFTPATKGFFRVERE
jgi:hypothetical protein